MPRVYLEILINSCYVAQSKIKNLANQNPESLKNSYRKGKINICRLTILFD